MTPDPNWEVFQRLLPELLADPEKRGQHALLGDGRLDSIWPTFEKGLAQGYKRFGLKPFLVQQILSKEEEAQQAQYVSRNIRRFP